MKTKKLAWILAGSSAVAGAVLGLAACSGDDTKPITTKDSGTDSTTGTDSGKDSATDSGTPDTGGDSAAVCTAKLRPNPEAGPFCAFVAKPNDGGTGVNCATGETCCYGASKGGDAGFDPTVCVAGNATSCPAPTVSGSLVAGWECTEKDDCTGNNVCCIVPLDVDGGVATLSTGVDSKTSCTFVKGEKGTRCKTSCAAGEWQGCQSDSECGAKKCILVDVGSGDRLQMGYCN